MQLRDSVSVRPFQDSDISMVLDYWYRSGQDFISSLGVDLAKLPSENQMRESLSDKNKQKYFQTITYRSLAIGTHSVYPCFSGDFAVFHSHIMKPEFRRRGIGSLSYLLACKNFIETFNLQRVLFGTPNQNIGAMRIKEKLQIREIDLQLKVPSLLRDGISCRYFELTAEELSKKLETFGL